METVLRFLLEFELPEKWLARINVDNAVREFFLDIAQYKFINIRFSHRYGWVLHILSEEHAYEDVKHLELGSTTQPFTQENLEHTLKELERLWSL